MKLDTRLWSCVRQFVLAVLICMLFGCALQSRFQDVESPNESSAVEKVDGSEDSEGSTIEVPDEYSIKEDRSQFNELRKSIPEVQKVKNDELAFVLNLMKEFEADPNRIRGKFDRVMRKKRDKSSREMRKERDKYNKIERRSRESFLKKARKKRDKFNKLRKPREVRTEFNQDYQRDRDEFFNNLREKRREFESDSRERRRNFESYAREKSNEFNGLLRAYRRRFYDNKSAERLKKKVKDKQRRKEQQQQFFSNERSLIPKANKQLEEFDIIKSKPANSLNAGDE